MDERGYEIWLSCCWFGFLLIGSFEPWQIHIGSSIFFSIGQHRNNVSIVHYYTASKWAQIFRISIWSAGLCNRLGC